ncbi:MAG TPA: YceI family protein [Candidatus Limnocylindrales bacterium]|jgi:polyisoprenoid-binding protein YceI|nr:YceI family protein [Candidatus Limnocylindrales bacterium]
MTATTWRLDPAHTDIAFSAKHMMITTVRGAFADVDGTLEIEESDAPTGRGEIRVKAASINTGFGARDEHLRSADFFDVATYPEIVVRFDGVQPTTTDRYRVNADVTIRDVTRTVPFDVEYVGVTTNMKGGRHIAFTAQAKIDREAWGLTWNMALEQGGWLVGKEIKLIVEVVADEVEVAAPASAEEPAPATSAA